MNINELKKGDKVAYVSRNLADGKGGFRDVEIEGTVTGISLVTEREIELAKTMGKPPLNLGEAWKIDLSIPDNISGRGYRTIFLRSVDVERNVLCVLDNER